MIHITDSTSSKAILEKLKIFGKSTTDQICTVLLNFYSFTFEKGTDMSTHISKVENIVHRLKALSQQIDEQMILSKILLTLPEKCKYTDTAWESAA